MTRMIEARTLQRRFGDLTAVEDVSFSVDDGEVVGLLGANGAGKTTTIRMLIGLDAPTSGDARLGGEIPSRRARRRLGYVPQSLGLYSDLTVEQNVTFIAGAFGVPPIELPPVLGSVADRLVGHLALGLQRQLAFVCALQHRPDVLVLDEPTSGVEPLGASLLWDRIRVEANRGAGVLVSTHSMQEARQCDRLLLMDSGRIVARGTEQSIIGPTTATVVNAPSWTRAFEVLSRAGELVTLSGRDVRVADADPDTVRTLLRAEGIDAAVGVVPATLDEKMIMIAAT